MYAFTTLMSPTLDWPPLCVTGALQFFILFWMYVLSQRSFTLELIRVPQRSSRAEMRLECGTILYTSYHKEHWPQAQYLANRSGPCRVSFVPSLPLFIGYTWDVHGWENDIVTKQISAHTHWQVRARQWTATNAAAAAGSCRFHVSLLYCNVGRRSRRFPLSSVSCTLSSVTEFGVLGPGIQLYCIDLIARPGSRAQTAWR
jgi:hypothetical protein